MLSALQEIESKISAAGSGPEKAQHTLAYCEALLKIDPQAALGHSSAVLQYALGNGNVQLAARTYMLQGNCFIVLSDFNGARQAFKEALQNYRECNDQRGCADAVNQLGTAFVSTGNYEKALECYYEAMQKGRKLGDRALYASTLANIGNIYRRKCNYEQAIKFHEQSIEVREEIGDITGHADSLLNIGAMHCSLNNYDTAFEYFLRAMQQIEGLHDMRRRSMVLNNIGNVYYAVGEFRKALAFHSRSLLIKQALKDLAGESTTLNNCAGCHYQLGDNQAAISFMMQSLEIKKKIGDSNGSGMIWANLAEIYCAEKEYDKAEYCLGEARTIYAEIQDVQVQIQILSITGLLAIGRRDAETALELLHRARELAAGSQQKELLGRIHKYLSEVYSQIENYRDRRQAMEHFGKSAEIGEEIAGEKQKRAIHSIELRYNLNRMISHTERFEVSPGPV